MCSAEGEARLPRGPHPRGAAVVAAVEPLLLAGLLAQRLTLRRPGDGPDPVRVARQRRHRRHGAARGHQERGTRPAGPGTGGSRQGVATCRKHCLFFLVLRAKQFFQERLQFGGQCFVRRFRRGVAPLLESRRGGPRTTKARNKACYLYRKIEKITRLIFARGGRPGPGPAGVCPNRHRHAGVYEVSRPDLGLPPPRQTLVTPRPARQT